MHAYIARQVGRCIVDNLTEEVAALRASAASAARLADVPAVPPPSELAVGRRAPGMHAFMYAGM